MKHLFILLGGFEIWDGLITHWAVRNGLVQEANPFIRSMVMEGNFLLLKITGALLSVLILWGMSRHASRVTAITTLSVVLFYGAVTLWNLNTFFRL